MRIPLEECFDDTPAFRVKLTAVETDISALDVTLRNLLKVANQSLELAKGEKIKT